MPIFKLPPEYGTEPVPREKRVLGSTDLALFWMSLSVGLLVLQAGAVLTKDLGLPLTYAFLVTVAGSVVGCLMLALVGVIGSTYGIPTMVSLRPTFGIIGSYLPTTLNVIQLIGWTAFEFIIMGEAAATISGSIFGGLTRSLWVIIFGAVCYLMMVSGPLIIIRQWIEKFALWISILTTAWITFIIFTKPVSFDLTNFELAAGLMAFDIVVAMPVSWMPLVADYTRFSRERKSGFKGTFFGYLFANIWFFGIGAALALFGEGATVVYSIALLVLGNFALLALLVDETDNAFADIYSASVSIQNIFSRTKQWRIGLLITVVALSIALATPITVYENFLLLIGASFVPVFGIVLADHFVINKNRYTVESFYSNSLPANYVAVAIWVLGFISYYFFAYVVQFGGTIPSFIIAFIAYVVLKRGEKK
ncbi:MAG: purine-cytosine permease family protein [Nitrososphaeria archaeon]